MIMSCAGVCNAISTAKALQILQEAEKQAGYTKDPIGDLHALEAVDRKIEKNGGPKESIVDAAEAFASIIKVGNPTNGQGNLGYDSPRIWLGAGSTLFTDKGISFATFAKNFKKTVELEQSNPLQPNESTTAWQTYGNRLVYGKFDMLDALDVATKYQKCTGMEFGSVLDQVTDKFVSLLSADKFDRTKAFAELQAIYGVK
jgi:hypothetical protein